MRVAGALGQVGGCDPQACLRFSETDGGVHNIRVMRNRGLNAAQHGLSAQPLFGGPAYFYRNIVYSVPMGGAIKTGGANPAGVLIYHNTFIAENSNVRGYSNQHYRNNLLLGTNHPDKPVLGSLTYTSYTSFDYNGYRLNPSEKPQIVWQAPGKGVLRDYALTTAGSQNFRTLAEFQRATGQEAHGLLWITTFSRTFVRLIQHSYTKFMS